MEFSEDVRLDGQPLKNPFGRWAKIVVKTAYAVAVTIGVLLFFGLVIGVPG